jgi:hypothetical protein
MTSQVCGVFWVGFLYIIATDHDGWDHVSVRIQNANRLPEWEEMCFVKETWFDNDECVMQLHPPKADYVNRHPYVLHLWRPQHTAIPVPPKELV